MPLYGRRDIPGERGVQGVQDQRNVLNRTLRAQVSAVNPENGYVVITYENMPSGGRYATVPPLWISFPDAATNTGPAWGRYMPQQSDLVKVSFDYDDSPHIMGYDVIAGDASVADGEHGWPQLKDQYDIARDGKDTKKARFAQFIPLNPGEYDFMSSGGAYIYGNNRGRLYLAGGSVSVSLVKNDLRISQRAQLWTHLADDCEFRFGQVRRIDSSDQLDKPLDDKTTKEFSIVLKTTNEPGDTTDLTSLKIGNVIDDTGTEENTPVAGNPMRFSYKAYNDDGEEILHAAIDKLGNWEMQAPNADIGVNFDFTASDWIAKFTNIKYEASELIEFKCKDHTHDATSSYKVTSPSVTFKASSDFTVDGPKILLGGAGAVHPLILTNVYRAQESTVITGLATQIATLAGVVSAIGALLQAGGAASTPPVVGAIAMGKIFQAGSAAITAGASAVASAAPTLASTFTGAYDSYLSQVSKTQ